MLRDRRAYREVNNPQDQQMKITESSVVEFEASDLKTASLHELICLKPIL